MSMIVSKNYDVAIVGSGIGGLVCGCYLAKSGMKVLIVERHYCPGGYCTSFRRGGFDFDSVIRGFCGCKAGGTFDKIFTELELSGEIEIMRSPIFDIIVTPEYQIDLENDYRRTLLSLQKIFPDEANNICKFFELLREENFLRIYSKVKNLTFRNLVDQYFKNPKVKSFFYFLRIDAGVSPSKTSALAGIFLVREYLLDGGYYPKGGMQSFTDAFVRRFKSYGGDILCSNEVTKIQVKNHKVEGVCLQDNTFIPSKYVISNGDVTRLFEELIDQKDASICKRINHIKRMVCSPSVFIVYLGLDKRISSSFKKSCSVWYIPEAVPNARNFDLVNTQQLDKSGYVICCFSPFLRSNILNSTQESIFLYVGAPYKNEKFWNKHRDDYASELIRRASFFLPDLRKHIVLKETATPITLSKYTLNRGGASRGWAIIPSQTKSNLISSETSIDGLFIAGHWTTSPMGNGGVVMVAASARHLAKKIIRKK